MYVDGNGNVQVSPVFWHFDFCHAFCDGCCHRSRALRVPRQTPAWRTTPVERAACPTTRTLSVVNRWCFVFCLCLSLRCSLCVISSADAFSAPRVFLRSRLQAPVFQTTPNGMASVPVDTSDSTFPNTPRCSCLVHRVRRRDQQLLLLPVRGALVPVCLPGAQALPTLQRHPKRSGLRISCLLPPLILSHAVSAVQFLLLPAVGADHRWQRHPLQLVASPCHPFAVDIRFSRHVFFQAGLLFLRAADLNGRHLRAAD